MIAKKKKIVKELKDEIQDTSLKAEQKEYVSQEKKKNKIRSPR